MTRLFWSDMATPQCDRRRFKWMLLACSGLLALGQWLPLGGPRETLFACIGAAYATLALYQVSPVTGSEGQP